MPRVFLYGPWADPLVWMRITGAGGVADNAILPGHILRNNADEDLPQIAEQSGCAVEGVVVDLDEPAAARLSSLQAAFDVQAVSRTVIVDGASFAAQTFVPYALPDGPEWHATDWTATKAAVVRDALCELAGLAATHPPEALRARWPLALSYAASYLRGQAETAPAALRRDWGPADVKPERQGQPYAWFFAVREDDLRFRQFDGSVSQQVRRAAFLMSDAVTVLPYDPVRDRVLVIEQFRYGTWLRGARNPWLLEPIAGRVDPFETPENAVLREAFEEARLSLQEDSLHAVGHVYPSPGAVTEFLYQYVAICDLPDGSEGVAGLDSEAENIRSHLISFDQLMTLVDTGEVQNGPLALAAWWLAAHRAKLRDMR